MSFHVQQKQETDKGTSYTTLSSAQTGKGVLATESTGLETSACLLQALMNSTNAHSPSKPAAAPEQV